jgi:hypothetical protein
MKSPTSPVSTTIFRYYLSPAQPLSAIATDNDSDEDEERILLYIFDGGISARVYDSYRNQWTTQDD